MFENIKKKISFLGAGHMGGALIEGIIQSGYNPKQIVATTTSKAKAQAVESRYGVYATTDNKAVLATDIIFICVKPNDVKTVIAELRDHFDPNKHCLISVAAGVTIKSLEQWSGAALPIIRSMPNLPCSIQQGVTAMFGNRQLQSTHSSFAENIFNCLGISCWLTKEADFNTIIAVAGSAPAYGFYLLEAMENKAVTMGLSKSLARKLAAQTIAGAAQMVLLAEESIDKMRLSVCSKGGTTAQAIEILQSRNFEKLIGDAMQAAAERGKALEASHE